MFIVNGGTTRILPYMSTKRPQEEVAWILVMMMMMMIEAFSILSSTLFSSIPGLCQPAKNACHQKKSSCDFHF